MRKWHRWLMTVFALLLLYWTVSGLVIALYDINDQNQVWAREGGGPGSVTIPFLAAESLPAPSSLSSGIQLALNNSSDIAIASVDLRRVGNDVRLQLADASGERSNLRRFYADSGESMTQETADSDYEASAPDNSNFRNAVKGWHKGNAAGLPGQFLGLLAGLSLISMCITGILLYFQQWKARCRSGYRQFFWSDRGSLWRRLHRWVAIVSAAFLLNIAISGSILAYGEIQLNIFLQYGWGTAPYPRPTPIPSMSEASLPADIPQMLERVYEAAVATFGPEQIRVIQLINRDGISKGLVTFNNRETLAYDALTGSPTTDWSTSGLQQGNGYFADWHQVIKRIHRGDIIGSFNGRYFDVCTGLALLYLTISGLILYIQMFQRRYRAKQQGLFWK